MTDWDAKLTGVDGQGCMILNRKSGVFAAMMQVGCLPQQGSRVWSWVEPASWTNFQDIGGRCSPSARSQTDMVLVPAILRATSIVWPCILVRADLISLTHRSASLTCRKRWGPGKPRCRIRRDLILRDRSHFLVNAGLCRPMRTLFDRQRMMELRAWPNNVAKIVHSA